MLVAGTSWLHTHELVVLTALAACRLTPLLQFWWWQGVHVCVVQTGRVVLGEQVSVPALCIVSA